MKKSKILYVCLCISFILLFNACGAINSNDKASQKNITTAISSSVSTKQPETFTALYDINTAQEDEKPVVYEILGDSEKLKKTDWNKMLEWRKSIAKTAEENPNLLFLNGQSKDKKQVCLTFDDGPDATVTPRILNILNENNVKGTFFFIGNRLDRFPSIVKRAYNAGNLVLCHGWDHTDLTNLSADQIKKQIESSQNKFSQLIGKKPLIMRPPYGDVNEKVLSATADENCKLVIWSIDALDWSQKQPSHIIKNVADNVRPGEIILMHSNEDKKATAEALPEIIKGLREKGYEFVTVSEMLGVDAYK